jgi:hypothetical protein
MRWTCFALRLSCTTLIALLTSGNSRASTLFQPAQVYRSVGAGAAGATAIVVADVNSDGKPDIVELNLCGLNNCDGAVGVLLGNGDGTFQAVKTTDTGVVFAYSLAVGDFNGDGKPDLVVSSGASCSPTPCSNLISVLLGKGDGTFDAPRIYGSGDFQANAVVVADVNGDGKLDLVAANQCSPTTCSNDGVAGVLLGNGDGTFAAAQTYNAGGAPSSLAVADVNGDGKPDLFVVYGSSLVGVLLGNGDGTFQPVHTYGTGGQFGNAIAVADVNGDGKPDLIVANSCVGCTTAAVGVLLGNGDGTFQTAQNYVTNTIDETSIAVSDVNADGKPDIVVANGCRVCQDCIVSVLLGNGDGTFKIPQKSVSGGSNAYSIAVADVNGDSNPDLIVANACFNYKDCKGGSGGGVGVLLNTLGKPTTTTLVSSLNPSVYGQPITWTATVIGSGSLVPTGTLNFASNGSVFATTTLNGEGIASLTRSGFNAGTYAMTALYRGDALKRPSTSAGVNQVVQQTTSSAALSSSSNPSIQGSGRDVHCHHYLSDNQANWPCDFHGREHSGGNRSAG